MSELNLYKASGQWAKRPPDERFASVKELHESCQYYRNLSERRYLSLEKLNLHADEEANEVLVNTEGIGEARFTTWGFDQLSYMAGAPPAFLRKLPAKLAVDCMTYGLRESMHDDMQVLLHNGETKLVRSIMTPAYKRIYNSDVTQKLLGLLDYGWRVPPARPAFPGQDGTRIATLDDVLDMESFSLSVKVGDEIAPAGLYASAHDMFAFMIDPQHPIQDGTSETPLYRGFFCWNSEVGASVFGIQTFLFRHVCGNHIVWGANNVKIARIKHIGKAEFKFRNDFAQQLIEYTNTPESIEKKMIENAKNKILGDDKEEVIDTILSRRIKLGKRFLSDAYDEAEMTMADGNPRSVWGMMNGVTRKSQELSFADERNVIDIEAGKILQLAQ